MAKRIEAARLNGPPGQPGFSFSGFDALDMKMVIASEWCFPTQVRSERLSLASEAIFDAAATGLVTGDRLKSSLERVLVNFLKAPPQSYLLVTSLLMPATTKLQNLRVDGHTLTFSRIFPKKFDRSVLNSPLTARYVRDDSSLLKVRVRVMARSPQGGYHAAIDTVDYIRGCWNLSLNGGLLRNFGAEQARPLNKILPGPVHTLHSVNGSKATDEFWYEPEFEPSHNKRLHASDVGKIQRDFGVIRSTCSSSKLGVGLRRALIRYCRALDSRDPQTAFIRLWGVLEYLTDTGRGGYAQTVRRTAFLFDDLALNKLILNSLRTARNRSIHSGEDRIDRENLVILHHYVVRLILFLSKSSRTFNSIAEAGEFLGLPSEAKTLLRKSELLKRALKFREIS